MDSWVTGRSAGGGIGYPPQYFWASLVAESVNNQPKVQETWVQSLGWEGPLEEGMAVFLPGHPNGQRSLVGYSLWGHKESNTTDN